MLFLFVIRPTIPYFRYFLRQTYMLLRLYPISLDTYSTSSPNSKQRWSTSYLNSAVGCLGACCNDDPSLWESLICSHACSPTRLSCAHTSGKALIHLGIPTDGLQQLLTPAARILLARFLPALLYTFSCLLLESNFLSASPSVLNSVYPPRNGAK